MKPCSACPREAVRGLVGKYSSQRAWSSEGVSAPDATSFLNSMIDARGSESSGRLRKAPRQGRMTTPLGGSTCAVAPRRKREGESAHTDRARTPLVTVKEKRDTRSTASNSTTRQEMVLSLELVNNRRQDRHRSTSATR